MLYLLLSHMTQHTLLPAAKYELSPLEKCKLSDFIEITLSRVIFRETSQETKNKCYCKKKIDHNFPRSISLVAIRKVEGDFFPEPPCAY